jgi:hypothetical protein
MAPHTTSGLTGGMARGGRIHCENYGFIGANGPVLVSAISHSPDLHHENLSSMAYGGHTPRNALGDYIPYFTYLEGLVPSLVTNHGQVSHLSKQRTMAHDELARGMASTSHNLLGNHMVNHTKGPVSTSALGHGVDLHLRNLRPIAYCNTLGVRLALGTCIA